MDGVNFKLVNTMDIIIPKAVFQNEVSTASFDPISKIYAAIKKKIAAEYGLSIAAWFKPELEKGRTFIHYDLSFTDMPENMSVEEYIDHFWDTSPLWSRMFHKAIQEFVAAKEDGLTDYLAFLGACDAHDVENISIVNEMLNRFLISHGWKKPAKAKK